MGASLSHRASALFVLFGCGPVGVLILRRLVAVAAVYSKALKIKAKAWGQITCRAVVPVTARKLSYNPICSSFFRVLQVWHWWHKQMVWPTTCSYTVFVPLTVQFQNLCGSLSTLLSFVAEWQSHPLSLLWAFCLSHGLVGSWGQGSYNLHACTFFELGGLHSAEFSMWSTMKFYTLGHDFTDSACLPDFQSPISLVPIGLFSGHFRIHICWYLP